MYIRADGKITLTNRLSGMIPNIEARKFKEDITMGMVVQHNMNALNAYNKLNTNVAGLKKSSEKLLPVTESTVQATTLQVWQFLRR